MRKQFSAVRGCTYVLHVATPVPLKQPKDANEVLKPAVDGTLHVLRAAANEPTVKRIVLCSSIVAISSEQYSPPSKGLI